MRTLRVALGALAIFALASAPARAEGAAGMRIEAVESGRTPAGQPWFRVRFAEPYPPLDVTRWWAAVTISTRRRNFQFSVRRDGSRWERRFVDRAGRPVGPAVESVVAGDSLLVVLPVRATRGARYLVQAASQTPRGFGRDSWGSPGNPKPLGERVVDPFLLFGPGTPVSDLLGSDGSPAQPPSRPTFPEDALPLGAVALGASIGLAALAVARPTRGLGRSEAAAVLGLGGLAGAALGAGTPVGGIAGSTLGLVSTVAAMLAARRRARLRP